VVWYTSYNHRFEPLIAEAKHALDKGALGSLYHGRFFYGNGTVANLAGNWREQGMGIVEDLIPHLLDLLGYLCDGRGQKIVPWSLERQEAKTYDHCVLATADGRFVLESSFLSWKNDFSINLYGAEGSLHMKGLCKWGPSELVVYQRVRPSGVPHERRETKVGEDLTWRRDLEWFERQCETGRTTAENDWWISETIRAVTRLRA
jgi:predicted dehydrogenase